jgi:hypothetical protein
MSSPAGDSGRRENMIPLHRGCAMRMQPTAMAASDAVIPRSNRYDTAAGLYALAMTVR